MSARPDSAPASGTPAELSGLLTELMSLLNRRSAGDALALMNEAGLTMGQMVTLFVLDFVGDHSIGALAQKAHLSPAAASHMIDQLVHGGLVRRTEDPEDRRARKIAITARGRAFIRRLDAERRRELSEVAARFKPRTAQRLAEVLRDAVEELRFPGDCSFPGPRARRAGRQG
jgi:DNA-binding MarR family transcriptional regulator